MSTFGGQGKLRSTVPGPYRKENKTIFLLKNGKSGKVNYDRLLVNYDRPLLGYIGRKSKVNYDRPLVNYDRPLLEYPGKKNDMARKVKYDRKSLI